MSARTFIGGLELVATLVYSISNMHGLMNVSGKVSEEGKRARLRSGGVHTEGVVVLLEVVLKNDRVVVDGSDHTAWWIGSRGLAIIVGERHSTHTDVDVVQIAAPLARGRVIIVVGPRRDRSQSITTKLLVHCSEGGSREKRLSHLTNNRVSITAPRSNNADQGDQHKAHKARTKLHHPKDQNKVRLRR